MADDGIGVVEAGGEVAVETAKGKGKGREGAETESEVSRHEERADVKRAERSDVKQERPAGEGPNRFDAGEGRTAGQTYIRVGTAAGERTALEAKRGVRGRECG